MVFSEKGQTVSNPAEHSDYSDYMCLGVLSLASAVDTLEGVEGVYLDGTVVPFPQICEILHELAPKTLLVAVSCITANYEAGVFLLDLVKRINNSTMTVIGNDHFTAMPDLCLDQRPQIDVGFIGNDVVGSFKSLVYDLVRGEFAGFHKYPGAAWIDTEGVHQVPQRSEPIFVAFNYDIVDRFFVHSDEYRQNFLSRVAPRWKKMQDVQLHSGIPVEIARGCIKFARNDACSFCSIQFGGSWRSQVRDSDAAWQLLSNAIQNGHDYLYLTADELPLTFMPLLSRMAERAPDWWTQTSEKDRPVIVGYGRADGVADLRRAEILRSVGLRQVMIGMDAGTAVSLAAMNKPLMPRKGQNAVERAERLFDLNIKALQVARSTGLLVRVGFVMGHLGMTKGLLAESVDYMRAIIREGRDVISALDIEVLSPQPGSLDYSYLCDPSFATAAANGLGLSIAESPDRRAAAEQFRTMDVVDCEEAMAAYTAGLMPGVEMSELAEARRAVRQEAKSCGVTIGEPT